MGALIPKTERIAKAIYEIEPAFLFVTPAGDWSPFCATDESRPVPWEKVRDEQWHVYFRSIDQAIVAQSIEDSE